MTGAKSTTVLKREASEEKEVLLQHLLATYQEALMSNETLSVHKAAHCYLRVTMGI